MNNTAAQIEDVLTTVREFKRTHPGIDYGEDFAAIAMELYNAKAFTEAVKGQALMGIVASLSFPKDSKENPDSFDKWLAESPVREPLAMMFYAGYRFARATFEAAQLERMHGDKP